MRAARRMRSIHSDIRGPLYQKAIEMQSQGIQVLKMNTGNPAAFGFDLPQSVREALNEHLDEAVPYCESRGMPAARQAVLEYHKSKGVQNLEDRDVFIGNGVSEMAEMLILSILDPGDELLVPCPNYSLWSNAAYLAGAKPVHYRCDEQSDWYPDIHDIEQKITARTKAMLIINPNNPTGAVYDRQCLLDMLSIARKHNLIVISDEIYDRLILDDIKHESTAALAPDLNVVTLNGLSKSHIICGFRCGWMVLSSAKDCFHEVRSALDRLSSMRLCGNALTQLVIPAALHDTESTMQMVRPGGRLFEQRKAVIDVLSNAEGFSCVPNKAAFYLFPHFDHEKYGIADDHEFCMELLEQKHILVVPGSGFGYPTPNHFRIVMLPEPEALRQAALDIVELLHNRL